MSAIAKMKQYLLARQDELLAKRREQNRPRWEIFGPDEDEQRERLRKSAELDGALDEARAALSALDKYAVHSFTEQPSPARTESE